VTKRHKRKPPRNRRDKGLHDHKLLALNRSNTEMNVRLTWWWMAIVCGLSAMAGAPSQLLSNPQAQQLFAGVANNISITFSNTGNENFGADIHLRMFQIGSPTAVPLGDRPWKQLEVLPHQTIVESAQLEFPAVNAETKFLVQWMAGTNHIIGGAEVLAYPSNLLHELKLMFHTDELGLLDPNNLLKPSFVQNHVEFLDLEKTALEDFSGKLAIIGPFESKAQMREGLPKAIQKIAMKGTAVIWIQPPANRGDDITPSFYLVSEAKAGVVIVQPEMIADFTQNPAAQLNLIRFCKLAVRPVPFALPVFTSQP